MLNELLVNARFIGEDKSRGFSNGYSYKLRLIRLRGNSFLALSVGAEDGLYCEYESVFSFLSNWTEVIVVLR